MNTLYFPSHQIFSYVLTGKLKAPSPQWKHDHAHLYEYELFVMTEGTLYVSYNNENFAVQEGEYLILPPSDGYRDGYKTSYCAFYWLHFSIPQNFATISPDGDQQAPDGLYSNYFALPQTGTVPKAEKLIVLMKQLQDIVKNNYPLVSINTMTTNVITELYGQLSLYKFSGHASGIKQIDYDIINYIKQNIHKSLTITEIAAHFGYNPKYLSHKFAKTHGTTLKEFIISQKVDIANSLLTDTNLPISEISKELGFSDSHNFSRLYKSITGLTPTEYRNTFAKRLMYDH